MKTNFFIIVATLLFLTSCQMSSPNTSPTFSSTTSHNNEELLGEKLCKPIKWSNISIKLREKNYSEAASLIADFGFHGCNMVSTDIVNVSEAYQLVSYSK